VLPFNIAGSVNLKIICKKSSIFGIKYPVEVFSIFVYKSSMKYSSKVKIIVQTLKERYPVVKTQLEHDTAFQLLIATIMSAQCTDNQVNKVSKVLFAAYPDPLTMSRAPLTALKKIIYSTGFYNNKAKNIKACANAILENHNGEVPQVLEKLVKLPGVGRKTANVVLSAAFGYQTIVVDTHVLRISNRLGLTEKQDPVKVEFELMKIIPEKSWNDISLEFIYFGREICRARKPLCKKCSLLEQCCFIP